MLRAPEVRPEVTKLRPACLLDQAVSVQPRGNIRLVAFASDAVSRFTDSASVRDLLLLNLQKYEHALAEFAGHSIYGGLGRGSGDGYRAPS